MCVFVHEELIVLKPPLGSNTVFYENHVILLAQTMKTTTPNTGSNGIDQCSVSWTQEQYIRRASQFGKRAWSWAWDVIRSN